MIDWTKDVEVATLGHEDWEDFQPIYVNHDHVYGHLMRRDARHAEAWEFSGFRFRNKPAEPKRVRGWINVYRSRSCGALFERKNQADCVASPDRIACVEIDIHEGHGLEDQP